MNSWDVEAGVCSAPVEVAGDQPGIAVFDNGTGMTVDELENLWHIGVSSKANGRAKRKLIGKFGIGKLASYSVARRATYVPKTTSGINAVAIDFEDFANATDTARIASPVTLQIRSIPSVSTPLEQLEQLEQLETIRFDRVLDVEVPDPDTGPYAATSKRIDFDELPSWTLVILGFVTRARGAFHVDSPFTYEAGSNT